MRIGVAGLGKMGAAMAARLAEMVGAMEALRDITLEYIKTRRQFGVAIGRFQSLQHRMVDITIACEEARSMLLLAISCHGRPRLECRRIISSAKYLIGTRALFVARHCVQLHGGIGTANEYIVSHYLKRLMALDMLHGNTAYHRGLVAAMDLDQTMVLW